MLKEQFNNRNLETKTDSCLMSMQFPDKLQVDVIGVAHTVDYFRQNEQFFDEVISASDFVGVEIDYFELKQTGMIPKDMDFYDLIFEKAWIHKKPVVCCDPNTETLGLSLLDVSMGVTSLVAGGLISIDLGEKINQQRLQERKLSRRDFIRGFIGVSASALIFQDTIMGDAARFMLQDCQLSSGPLITDKFSYDEFRSSALMKGLW